MTFSSDEAIFHEGEIAIQTRLGISDRMEKFGRKMIRSFMPEQHQTFYQQLPYLFAGYQNKQGEVWASVLTGDKGFISPQNEFQLAVSAQKINGDPIYDAIQQDPNLRIGLLGIDLSNRRRNRMSAQLSSVNSNSLMLNVLQAFGNCPQYIQTRTLQKITPPSGKQQVQRITTFNEAITKLIENADSMFVASSSQNAINKTAVGAEHGADMSYRGGQPGFIRVDNNNTLTIPDFSGNNHFNTLGNIEVNPNVGLLFLDFENGDIISLTGTAKILWDSDEYKLFKGAQRLWQFQMQRGVVLPKALPYRWTLEQTSPNSLMTDTWLESRQRVESAKTIAKSDWLTAKVSQISDESASIRSFYLDWPTTQAPDFKAGQFVTIKVTIDNQTYIRNYTISSAPDDKNFRISVKREKSRDGLSPDGKVSSYLHTQIKVGDEISVRLPQGQFTIDPSETRTVVMLSAGVGITPMVSMLKDVFNHGIKHRHCRPVIMLNSVRNGSEQAFAEELQTIQENSQGSIAVLWNFTRPSEQDENQKKFHLNTRLNKALLQRLLPIDHYQFYLCGPAEFIQDTYNLLLSLGVRDEDIEAEAFGPAGLKRQKPKLSKQQQQNQVAPNAIIEFASSKVEQSWDNTHDDLLSFAEAHGLEPVYGCRTGQCGACAVKIKAGKVMHSDSATATIGKDEALLCCAKPKRSVNGEIPVLTLRA